MKVRITARVVFAAAVLSAALVAPSQAHAQRLQVFAAASVGTGVSLGNGADGAAARRSSLFLDLRVMFANSEVEWLRYGVSIRGEVEDKVTIGGVPQVAIVARHWRIIYGVMAGLPIVIMPKSLFGVEVGAYGGFQILDWLVANLNLSAAVYPIGNDLPKDSVLVMLQLHVGVEVQF